MHLWPGVVDSLCWPVHFGTKPGVLWCCFASIKCFLQMGLSFESVLPNRFITNFFSISSHFPYCDMYLFVFPKRMHRFSPSLTSHLEDRHLVFLHTLLAIQLIYNYWGSITFAFYYIWVVSIFILYKLNKIKNCVKKRNPFLFAILFLYSSGHWILWPLCDVPTVLYLLQVFIKA